MTPPADPPEISVVVPTYRRPQLLARCLDALAGQETSVTFEVVVVDDGSADTTVDVLRANEGRLGGMRWFSQPENRGPGAARNRAIREARADLVLFLDDDIVAPSHLVDQHVAVHRRRADPALGILGRVEWHPELRVTPFMQWLDRSGLQFAFDTWLEEGPVDPPFAAFYTANLSVPRRLLFDAGLFDERFPFPAYEDMELAWRLTQLGFRMEHAPGLVAYHSRPIDLATFRERMAFVAESAEVVKRVQPEFPIDHHSAERGWMRRRWRTLLRLAAPLARLLGWRSLLDRHYRAEVAAAYRAGRSRAAAATGSSERR